GQAALTRLKTGISREDIVQLKEEILATEVADLNELSSNLQKALAEDTIVVIGNKTQIEAEEELFDEIFTLY
ncbi:MAG TPA: hypothetical protein VK021_04270, partial [Flavobacteriaceae bacterium]|nr:hypothetical protein [Flavobacteriaceae bacterium]